VAWCFSVRGGLVFFMCEVAWCLLGERWLGVCYVRGALVFFMCEMAWCLLGERWLGVC